MAKGRTGPSRMGLLPSWSPRGGKCRREGVPCLRVVLVSSSPEHLQNRTMIKRIGRRRQLRGTGGEKGDIQKGRRETEFKNFKAIGRWTDAKISGGQSTNLPAAAAFFRAASSPWTVSIASIKHGVDQPNHTFCSSLLFLHSEACSDILSSSM